MNIKYLPIAFFVFFFGLGITNVGATVGGPSLVYNLRTNVEAREVVYDFHGLDGKGCPPEVFSLNLETGELRVVADCDDPEYEAAYAASIVAYPIPLARMHLPYNQVSAKASVLREIEVNPDNFAGGTEFGLDLFQVEKKIAAFTYFGCYPNQPHILEAYGTADESVAVIVVSTIGDCFEGGYIRERVFVAKGLTSLYDYSLGEGRKTATPAVVDADAETGNIVVFASKAATATPSATGIDSADGVPRGPIFFYQIVVTALSLLVATLALRFRR